MIEGPFHPLRTASKSHLVEPGSSANSITSKPRNPGRIISAKEIEEKRAKSFFFSFFFNEGRYFPGHKCKARVYQLEIMEEEGQEIAGSK